MSDDWQNKLTTARMQVDQRFQEKLDASEFSRQQWSLIMTAVEFDIDHPDNPKQARLVAVTDKLPSIMGELDKVDQAGPMGGGDPGPGGGGGGRRTRDGGIIGDLKSLFGFGGGSNNSQLAAAEELAQDYANELQLQLERDDRWEQIRIEVSETRTEHTP